MSGHKYSAISSYIKKDSNQNNMNTAGKDLCNILLAFTPQSLAARGIVMSLTGGPAVRSVILATFVYSKTQPLMHTIV